jgi:ABC-2 type transport system permease protein
VTGLTSLTGTWFLIRFTAMRDRVRIGLWILAVVGLVLLMAASVQGLYPTQHDLDEAAAAATGNAAMIAFNGPVQGLDTVGGEVTFQAGAMGLTLIGLMSLLLTVRYTRGEEETGRTELLRAAMLGRDAQAASALVLVTGMNLVIAVAVAVGLAGLGLPAVGSVCFGLSFLAVGVVFTVLALVTGQVTENSRVASGMAGIVLGAAFVLRAVGDIHGSAVTWLSPIGWVQKARPYAGERWWPFLVPAVVALALLAAARTLTAHRDWGAGLVRSRPGGFRAAPALGRPLGLAIRMNRANLVGWTASLLVLGAAYGSIANDIRRFVADNQAMQDIFTGGRGADLTDAYVSTAILTLALVGCCFPIQTLQRLRAEETASHAEAVLATPTSRLRWMGSHLTVAAVGGTVAMTAAGLGVGLPYSIETGDAGHVVALVGAALAYLPAIGVLTGLTAALYGVAPRTLPATWVLLVGCFIVGFLGQVLKLPHRIVELSPFQHTPQLPAANLSVPSLAILTAIALVLAGIGLLALPHRDIG